MSPLRYRQRQYDPASWRHVVITGGAAGLGAALAQRFARAGVLVSLVDRNAAALEQLHSSLGPAKARVRAYACDVSSLEQLAGCASSIGRDGGEVDAAFLCAAIGDSRWIRTLDAAAFRTVIETNLLGIVNALECFVPGMARRGFGVIVPVSSLLDVRGYAGTAPYSASKAALRSLCDSARTLCAPRGVRIVLARPGFMATALATGNHFRMPGILTPERAAEIIVHGLRGRRSIIAFPRWLAAAAETVRLLPRPVFDAVARRMLTMEGLDDVLEQWIDDGGGPRDAVRVGEATDAAARARAVEVLGA